MYLSKDFVNLNCNLFIAKLQAYSFQMDALKLFDSFLRNSCYRSKVNSSYRLWKELIQGIPQGSFLKLLPSFHFRFIWMAYLLFWIYQKTENNNMKVNQVKCSFQLSRYKHGSIWTNSGIHTFLGLRNCPKPKVWEICITSQ